MNTKINLAITENNLVQKGDKIIVAVSGGADSMALLHYCKTLSDAGEIQLSAAHINHGLRGDAADEDEKFVIEFCNKNSIELVTHHAELKDKNLLSEDDARKARYDFLDEISGRKNAVVATAHTLNDNAETVLMRLTRGCFVTGAAGIPIKRGRYIRPMLRCSRTEVEEYCKANNLEYVTDQTNFEDNYARNKIRLNTLPSLAKVNSAAIENIASFGSEMAELKKYLDDTAHSLLKKARCDRGYKAEHLMLAPPPLRRIMIAEIIKPFTEVDKKMIKRAEDLLYSSATRAQLSGSVFAEVRREVFSVYREVALDTQEIPFSTGEITSFIKFSFEIKKTPYDQMIINCKQNKKELKNFANCGIIKYSPIFRTRRTGDRFKPAGRGVTKSIKKLFIEDGVPQSLRDQIPLLAIEDKVIWIYGYGFSEDVIPQQETGEVIYIEENKKNPQGE